MATKAEEYRSATERARSKPHPKPRARRGKPLPKAHNLSVRAKKNAAYEYEETPPGKRPPRKSTRTGKNGIKNGEGQLHITVINNVRSPSARASRPAPTLGGKAKARGRTKAR
jgi:hypothetical protein